jgi:hypothetical protein
VWQRIPGARQHAAEILRPRPIHHGIEDYVTDMTGAQILGLRREPEERVDLALQNNSIGLTEGSVTH